MRPLFLFGGFLGVGLGGFAGSETIMGGAFSHHEQETSMLFKTNSIEVLTSTSENIKKNVGSTARNIEKKLNNFERKIQSIVNEIKSKK